jgi:hypothetical protein
MDMPKRLEGRDRVVGRKMTDSPPNLLPEMLSVIESQTLELLVQYSKVP